jgi:phosphoserine aminotransferase
VEKDSRSYMNVVFRLPSEELEKKFVAEAAKEKMVGLAGHRSTGGIRVSTYNAVPMESIEALVAFMKAFQSRSELDITGRPRRGPSGGWPTPPR